MLEPFAIWRSGAASLDPAPVFGCAPWSKATVAAEPDVQVTLRVADESRSVVALLAIGS
jgi:hypothetical protein